MQFYAYLDDNFGDKKMKTLTKGCVYKKKILMINQNDESKQEP